MSVTFNDLLTKKVSLEFGNEEQIKAIDVVQIRHDEHVKKEKEAHEGKTREFRVHFSCSGSAEKLICAHTAEEAKAFALEDAWDLDWDMEDAEVWLVEEV